MSKTCLCCNSRCYEEATTYNQFDEGALLLCLLCGRVLWQKQYLQLLPLYQLAYERLVKMLQFILLQQSNGLNFKLKRKSSQN